MILQINSWCSTLASHNSFISFFLLSYLQKKTPFFFFICLNRMHTLEQPNILLRLLPIFIQLVSVRKYLTSQVLLYECSLLTERGLYKVSTFFSCYLGLFSLLLTYKYCLSCFHKTVSQSLFFPTKGHKQNLVKQSSFSGKSISPI